VIPFLGTQQKLRLGVWDVVEARTPFLATNSIEKRLYLGRRGAVGATP